MNVIEFPDEHACYYDEEDEQWFKEKVEQWAKNIPFYKEDAAKVVLNSMDFDFEMQKKDLDDFLKNLAAQDSSPQPTKVLSPASEVPTPLRVLPVPTSQRVPAPVVTVTTSLPRWVQVPSPQRVIGSWVPAPQRLLASQVPAKSEETLNSIAFEQVHVPIRYQHHLLPQNMEYNRVMLSDDSSRSIQMCGYRNFNSDLQQDELYLAVQQFMPHQMGGYGFSSNWPHDINHRN